MVSIVIILWLSRVVVRSRRLRYATMYVPRCYVVDEQGIVRFVTFEYEAGDVDRLLAELSKFIK